MGTKKLYLSVQRRALLLDLLSDILYKTEYNLTDDEHSLLSNTRFKFLQSLER